MIASKLSLNDVVVLYSLKDLDNNQGSWDTFNIRLYGSNLP